MRLRARREGSRQGSELESPDGGRDDEDATIGPFSSDAADRRRVEDRWRAVGGSKQNKGREDRLRGERTALERGRSTRSLSRVDR